MAIISKGIGWSQESNLLWYILKQLNQLTGVLFGLKPKYKVYTALLTQSGGDSIATISGGDLTVGRTYEVFDSEGGDWTNVGAPNNNEGTFFVATGTTPNSWNGGSLSFNFGAPVVTVLENTIGNIWFTYDSIGQYFIESSNLFASGKTWNTNVIALGVGGPAFRGVMYNNSNNRFYIQTESDVDTPDDGLLYNTPIEIRVYN